MNFTFIGLNPDLYNDINNLVNIKNSFIKVSDSIPDILILAGLPVKPLYFPRSKMLTGLLSNDNRNHGHKDEIGKKTLKKSLPHLGDPLAISFTEKNAFGVYLWDKASTGKPLYVYIRYDNKRDFNVILSVYGRISTESENFFYIDDTKLRQKWETTDYLVKKFKNKLEDFVYLEKCNTKTSIKKKGV